MKLAKKKKKHSLRVQTMADTLFVPNFSDTTFCLSASHIFCRLQAIYAKNYKSYL